MPIETYPTAVLTSGAMSDLVEPPKEYVDHAVIFVATHIPGDAALTLHHALQGLADAMMEHCEQNYHLVSNAHLKSEEQIMKEATTAADRTMHLAMLMTEAAFLHLAKSHPTPKVDELAANCRDAAMALIQKGNMEDGDSS